MREWENECRNNGMSGNGGMSKGMKECVQE